MTTRLPAPLGARYSFAMPIAILSEREPVGGALHRVRFDVDAELASTHGRHGQYVEIRYDGGVRRDADATVPGATKGHFVLASPPGSARWEVIAKAGGAMADGLISLPIGAQLATSGAQGRGYPVAEAVGLPLVFAVVGSGIAAALSTLHARTEAGEASRTFLLYGVRERKDVALSSDLEAMRRAGLEVAICLSREHIDEPGFFKGYVQHVAKDRKWTLTGGRVFAAGNKAMVEGLREAMPSLGLRPEDLILNH